MLTRRKLLTATAVFPVATLIGSAVLAAEPPVFAVDGIAIRGTDPVAYFDGNGPVEGSADHAFEWNGATWHFATEENKAKFMADPEAFAPQFGGYCAYAASLGYTAPTIPEAWTIYEGQLFLNANLRARELWLQDVPGNVAKGRANWPGLLG